MSTQNGVVITESIILNAIGDNSTQSIMDIKERLRLLMKNLIYKNCGCLHVDFRKKCNEN